MKNTKALNYFIPLLLGFICHFVVLGQARLAPSKIGWLSLGENSDMLQSYLGWSFFRSGPWNFPLGDNPTYGIDLRNSIVFTDSIPGLALALKPFTRFLSTNFQYLGLWLLICFLLQAYFAWKLMENFSNDKFLLSLSTLFFLFSPLMLARMNLHIALSSHFLILAGLNLYFKKEENLKLGAWFILLSTSLLVHFSIFLMTCFIFIAKWFSFAKKNIWATLLKSVILFISLFVIAWQAGYLIQGSQSTSNVPYGIFRLNLFAPANANGWSWIQNFSIFRFRETNVENFAYLGFGSSLLVLAALTLAVKYRKISFSAFSNHAWLFISMLVLLFLAISNNIGIANLDFKIPLPESITSLLSPVRASGRLVWPIMYLLLTYSLYITFKFVETKSAKVILCSLLVLQILDTSLGWKNLNLDSKNINNNLVLTDPRWNELAAQGIENIVVLPTSNECNRFVELGFIANQYGMATNCVYLARISTRDVDASRRRILNELLMDDLRSNTVYILSDAELALVSKLGAKNLQPENLNGFNVIRRKFVK